MRKAIEMFEVAMFTIAEKLVKGFNWLTGKSNFALAKVFLILTGCIIYSVIIYYYVQDEIGIFVFLFGAVLWPFLLINNWMQYRKLEKALKKPTQVLIGGIPKEWLYLYRWTRTDRVILPILGMIAVVVAPSFSMAFVSTIWWLLSLSAWTALYITPPGKSAYARAKEKVKNLVSSLRPSPLPSPSPA